MTEIIEEEWGCANFSDGKIQVNPKLKEFPELYQRVIQHEFRHAKTKGFWKQRKIDAQSEIPFRDLIPFYKKYPKFFIQQYSPIYYHKGTLFLEWSLIFLYISYILFAGLIFYLINLFSSDKTFFFSVIKYMVLLGIGIFILYNVGKWLRDSVNQESKRIGAS